MFTRIILNRNFIFAVLATVGAAMSLTMAPAARAQQATPDAMPTGTETVLYSFGEGPTAGKCKITDGASPLGSLTYVTATGLLFGQTSTTTSGGNGDGTVFQIMPNGTAYIVDHSFTGAKTDGNDPRHDAMTLLGTVLYGTTLTGGTRNNGTIFSINDDGSGYSTPPVYNFAKSAKNSTGNQPTSSNFVAVGNVLYGMTSQGGKHGGTTGDGTIYSFDTATSTYTQLYSFGGRNGADPHGALTLDPDGKTFYGMTRSGGNHDVGVIFSLTSAKCGTGSKCKYKYKVIHNFSCPGNSTPTCADSSDGASPDHGTLVQVGSAAVAKPPSVLYGLTTDGGAFGNGALFSIRTDGSHFTILQSFGKPGTNDGINPFGSLLLNGTTLYGTTKTGGSMGFGTVFQIDTDGTGYDRIYDFQGGTDAANPIDDVILLDNTLYGMTEAGGQCGNGAIFSLVPPP